MVFEPKGMYPRGTLHVPNGFFHADEKIAFSVVLGETWQELDSDVPFSEFDWASPQELRLLASLLFCEKMDGGYIRFYPIVRFGPCLDTEELDLRSPETLAGVRALILKHAAQRQDVRNEFSRLGLVRGKYELIETDRFAFDRLHEIWTSLTPRNYVLLRGAYALMKSDMLARHYEFSEEAIISLYIALEASFSLVRRRLQKEGNASPSAHDAAAWLHKHFDAPFGHPAPAATEKYFGEFYEQRIMTLHPDSRFGDSPYSPTMHDDIYHLRPWLRQLFTYLLTGQHDPGYLDAVRDYTARGFDTV
jgi:hypothetical protein